MQPSRLPELPGESFPCSASGFREGVLPLEPVGDGAQESRASWHVIVVVRLDLLPAIAGGVGCRNTEHLGQPRMPVAAVIGQRLARPFARDQHPPPGITQMVVTVSLALAGTRHQAGPGVLGLDAIAQPVRARWRARLIAQRVGEAFHVLTRGVSVRLMAVAELLGQVLGQISDTPGGVLGPGEHALGVELGPEPHHMPRIVIRADGVQGFIPGRQQLAGGGVEVAAADLIPHRQIVAIEADGVGGGPPDLVVDGGDDLPQLGPCPGSGRCPRTGVTCRPSNSTSSNGVPVGGVGIRSARILTTVSRGRPSSSGSMSETRHWNTGLPVCLSTAGDRRPVASS